MTDAVLKSEANAGWLRNPAFDGVFIVGLALIAIVSGAAVVANPSLFFPILIIDLWFLGYHHVIASYTRLCFTSADFQRYRYLLFYLPPAILVVNIAIGAQFGYWLLISVYFYWQWYHYTRQSWGVSRAYLRKSGVTENKWINGLAFYLLPVWGILHRSAQDANTFLDAPFRAIPIAPWFADAFGWLAIAALVLWGAYRVKAWMAGERGLAYHLYMATHVIVFYVAYVVIENITYGWLVFNIWHNTQYLLFVWLFNVGRFRGGVQQEAYTISLLSQPGNWWRYGLVFGALTILLYGLLIIGSAGTVIVGIPLIAILTQTLNFHHYIVDAIIWRRDQIQAAMQAVRQN